MKWIHAREGGNQILKEESHLTKHLLRDENKKLEKRGRIWVRDLHGD